MSKFGKNRSVDSYWYSVPTKYCLSVKGQRQNPKHENIVLKTANDLLKTEEFYENYKIPKEVYDESRKIELEIEQKTGKYGWKEGLKYIEDWVEENILKKVNKNKRKNFDKEFVIIQFFGKRKYLCAWRNSNKCNIGMPFMCSIVTKNKQKYVKYKNQYIPLSDSGWVI